MKNIMVDIETLSTEVDAAILSIGAVEFNPDTCTVYKSDAFYRVVDGASCLRAGLRVDANAVAWWMQQSAEARMAVFGDDFLKFDLSVVLKLFSDWCGDPNEVNMWCKGPDFDLAILRNAYFVTEQPVPWFHWRGRDLRTLESTINDHFFFEPDFKGIEHHALYDAIHQAKCACELFKILRY